MRTVSQPGRRPTSGDGPQPLGAQRRKQLRRERRADQLRQLWRLTLFSATAAGLGLLLLRQGWTLREPAQVEVQGSALVNRAQVIEAAGLHFPQPLLGLHPNQLRRRLEEALPVEQVKVSRLMLPPRLRVELVDREAVARAERRTSQGLQQGYVDRKGQWISLRQNQGIHTRGPLTIRVVGWNERHRQALETVLTASPRIGPGLQEIRFDPNGSLWLRTAELGNLRLGPVDSRLGKRLEVVAHLSATLPAQIRGRRLQLIDLSDPEQPELSLPGAASLAPGDGPSTARPPQGGQ
jgi:cell division protein FtsQ